MRPTPVILGFIFAAVAMPTTAGVLKPSTPLAVDMTRLDAVSALLSHRPTVKFYAPGSDDDSVRRVPQAMTLVLESYPACGDVAGPVEYAVGRLEGIQRIVFRFPDARDEDRCPQYAGADVADSGKVELLIYPDEPLPEVWPRNNQ